MRATALFDCDGLRTVVQLGKTLAPKQYALLLEQRDVARDRWARHVVIITLRLFWGPRSDVNRALASLASGTVRLVDDGHSLIPGPLSLGAARLKLELVRVLISEGEPAVNQYAWDPIRTPSRIQCSRLVADCEAACG